LLATSTDTFVIAWHTFSPAFLPKPDHSSLSGLEVVLDLQAHDRDPGKSVGKSPKQNAIAKADFVARANFIQDVLTSRAGFMAKMPFSVSQEK
jgi:hypothetical protein